jgi:uncharacterized protein (DUF362 family)
MTGSTERLAVVYGSNPREMVPALMDRLGVVDRIPRHGLIGIKPNLVVSKPSLSGATTDPEVVESIVEVLRARGFEDIVILESAWIGDSTERAFDVCGYRELSARAGVPLVNLEADTSTAQRTGDLSIRVCDTAKRLAWLINVPVLKAHCQTRITCALKNLKGLIPGTEKRRFHALGLDRPIACLNRVIRPGVTIVDGIVGDLSFEEGGEPVRMNRLIGGFDPVLVDAYAATLLGYRPEEIGHVRLAAEMGVGSLDLASAAIEALNEPSCETQELSMKRPSDAHLRRIHQDRACSACVGGLLHALKRMGDASRLPQELHVGQGFKNKKMPGVGIGTCAKGFERAIPGCPPSALEIRRFLEGLG